MTMPPSFWTIPMGRPLSRLPGIGRTTWDKSRCSDPKAACSRQREICSPGRQAGRRLAPHWRESAWRSTRRHTKRAIQFLILWTAFETTRSEEHTSELQSRLHLVCRLLLEKKKKQNDSPIQIPPVSPITNSNDIEC